MRYVCSEPRVPRPRDRGLAKRSGPTATPAFEPAFEFSRALAALPSSSASEFLLQRFYAPTGERLRAGSTTSTRSLTTATTNTNLIMDHDTNDAQGRPSGGGMQTRSGAAPGKRSRGRAKKATPSGPRGPRAPASTADITPGGVTNAETIGAGVIGCGFEFIRTLSRSPRRRISLIQALRHSALRV